VRLVRHPKSYGFLCCLVARVRALCALSECIAFPLGFEVNAELRVDDVANHDGAFACGFFKGITGDLIELIVGYRILAECWYRQQ
jgi:hypothetical protein